MADPNRYITNDAKAREAFATRLEGLAESVRSGQFEYVALAYQMPGRPDAVLAVTGPDAHDYTTALAGVEELGVRLRKAQLTGGF